MLHLFSEFCQVNFRGKIQGFKKGLEEFVGDFKYWFQDIFRCTDLDTVAHEMTPSSIFVNNLRPKMKMS